jgi:hypothetical protein
VDGRSASSVEERRGAVSTWVGFSAESGMWT